MKVNGKYAYFGVLLACILAICLSFFPLGNHFSSPDTYNKTIQSLDEKRTTVLQISTVAVASSAAVSALPGDTGTPIANKLMDLSTISITILSAIVLEKYMVTILGYVAFKVLIPLGILSFILFMLTAHKVFGKIAAKLVLFGLALCLLIPTSEKISSLIESTYQASTSVVEQSDTTTLDEDEKEKGFIEGLLDSGKEKVDEMIANAETQFNQLLESLAISVVVNCLIPILVVIFFLYLIKLFLGIDINLPIDKYRRRRLPD